MLGVVVNVLLTVLIGSGIGLLFKKGISERISSAVMLASGLGGAARLPLFLCLGKTFLEIGGKVW